MFNKIVIVLLLSVLGCHGADNETVTTTVSNDIDAATTLEPATTLPGNEVNTTTTVASTPEVMATTPAAAATNATTNATTTVVTTPTAAATNATTPTTNATTAETLTTTVATPTPSTVKIPCNDTRCAPYSLCMNQTYCACPEMKPSNDTTRVCGDDDVSYANKAKLENMSCQMNKKISLVNTGECELKRSKSKTIVIIVVLVILLLIIIAIAVYWVWKNKRSSGNAKLDGEKSGDALL